MYEISLRALDALPLRKHHSAVLCSFDIKDGISFGIHDHVLISQITFDSNMD